MDKANVHADHHALWVNPKRDSHVINGNDGGTNISYDNGENWFKANTPAVGQYYAITVDDAKPYNVYGGLQDNGSWWGPSTHRKILAGLIMASMLTAPLMVMACRHRLIQEIMQQCIRFAVWEYTAGIIKKERRGFQKSIRPQHELGEKPLRFNWQTPILLSKHNQDVFYYGSNRLYRSLNKADTLIPMSADLTNGRVTEMFLWHNDYINRIAARFGTDLYRF
ncbi:MAG: hypothetical protein IPP39_15195 [Chitinophagaceae bacterium]|nr:hypothetical protein [Chitinophagaceae bacterium]